MTDHFHHIWLPFYVDKVASTPVSIFEDTLKLNILRWHYGIFEIEMGASVCFCHDSVSVGGAMTMECCCKGLAA